MKLYKITFKDNRQTFLELKEGTAEELLQHINPAEVKSFGGNEQKGCGKFLPITSGS